MGICYFLSVSRHASVVYMYKWVSANNASTENKYMSTFFHALQLINPKHVCDSKTKNFWRAKNILVVFALKIFCFSQKHDCRISCHNAIWNWRINFSPKKDTPTAVKHTAWEWCEVQYLLNSLFLCFSNWVSCTFV